MALLSGCVKRIPTADSTIVFVAKRVHTMDPSRPVAQAVAWKHGALVSVGSEKEVLEAAGPDAIIERFPDSVIVPGLVDAHGHLAGLGRSLSVVSLGGATSEAEAVERVKAASPSVYLGEWLVGRGWDQNDWSSREFPNRAELDAAFPKTPIYLSRVDGHAAWVNGEALRRAGI
ncbi:MAG TPA: amidohydrolase family protein, partial [Archangium sp.]